MEIKRELLQILISITQGDLLQELGLGFFFFCFIRVRGGFSISFGAGEGTEISRD